MKKIGILVFAAAFVIGLVVTNIFSSEIFGKPLIKFDLGFSSIKGSGHVVEEKRDVPNFNAIDVGGVFAVESVYGDTTSVVVVADDNLLPLIETEVQGGTLSISSTRRLKSDQRLLIRVTSPAIERVETSGASSVSLSNPSREKLEIDMSGASKVTASGQTSALKADMSGASKLFAFELEASGAEIDGSGASRAEVNAGRSLVSSLSGASRVVYAGSPSEIRSDVSGASAVSAR